MVDRVELGTATLSSRRRTAGRPTTAGALSPDAADGGGAAAVLVDTGRRQRSRPPGDAAAGSPQHRLSGLAAAPEVAPESVDVVVNTHVHSDHVGWNTKREGDSWVPTFPNARYLIPEADYRFFHPDNAGARPAARTEDEAARQAGSRIVFQDSILPVERQIELWSDDHQISDSLRLRRPLATRPARRCCGWTQASPPFSSATSPTARCNCTGRPIRAHSTRTSGPPR